MLTRSGSSPPESAVGTTPALPPGGGRRMSGGLFRREALIRPSLRPFGAGVHDAFLPLRTVVNALL
ncbi:hypothetical protein JCM4914_34270 [Streptomyces platensis subsp. malvinus]